MSSNIFTADKITSNNFPADKTPTLQAVNTVMIQNCCCHRATRTMYSFLATMANFIGKCSLYYATVNYVSIFFS